jgi:hypothetical protein
MPPNVTVINAKATENSVGLRLTYEYVFLQKQTRD